MKKRTYKQISGYLCMILIPLCLLIPIILDFINKKLIVFPANNTSLIEPMTDAIWDGKSSFKDFSYKDNTLHINYILRNSTRKYPNVFVIFWLDENKSYIDLSQYKYITLRIKQASSQRVTLFIKTFEQSISDPEPQNAGTLRHNEKEIYLSPSLDTYKVNIDEFKTPRWWYETYHSSETEIGSDTYKTVVSFDMHFIHTKKTPVAETSQILTIEEIIFHKPVHIVSIVAAITCFIYYLFLFTWYFLKYRNKAKNKTALPEFKHLSYVNYREKELVRIKEYIKENYNDPDISTKKMQADTGISSVRIFNLIKEEYKCSFKQLINTLRVKRATSLIKESDLRIIEISYQIGFNDSTYFNKIFKQIAGITPTELRCKKESNSFKIPAL